jgi:thiosulfate/3-mercaptopyruvate sulfurtransferase
MSNRRRIVVLALSVLIVAVAATAQGNYKGYQRPEVFITVAELKAMIEAEDPKLVVIAVASVPEYYAGHIPGAIQVWRPDYEVAPALRGGVTDDLMLPEQFTVLAQKRFGIDPDSKVVVYDHQYDATRLWWAFMYYGKSDVKVLDGGFAGWTGAGYDTDMVSSGKAKGRGTWVAKVTIPALRAETPEIAALKDRTDAQLWDARGDSEYCGKEVKKGAFRAGRIAWGVQADWPLLKSNDNKSEFLPAADVQKILDRLGFDRAREQYFVCQSGVRTTQWIFVLYAMGWPIEKLHNYDDSWIGWSKDNALPLEKDCPDATPAPWQK